MASKTPSRPAARKNKTARQRTRRAPAAAKSTRTSTQQPRSAKAAKSTRSGRTKPAVELKISPAVRQKWERLTQRWKSLLPKIGNGTGSRPAKSARRRG